MPVEPDEKKEKIQTTPIYPNALHGLLCIQIIEDVCMVGEGRYVFIVIHMISVTFKRVGNLYRS